MSTILPIATDTLAAQDHARLHRCIASDSAAADSSIVVNSSGLPVIAALTASEIVATNASKALQSLDVATYPSLTELSYVKGASSALQTQITAKKSDSMSTNKLLGRGTAGTGAIEEITLGTNLSLSGTTLNATGGGASATELSFTNSDLAAGILTVTHSKGLTAGYTALVTVVNNSGAVVIPDQINTFATNSFKVDLSSFGTLTGTWYCIYITK